MNIELRATERLTGAKPLDVTPVLAAIGGALPSAQADLTKLRVVCDWVQYRQNFRGPVDVRTVMPRALDAGGTGSRELAIDLRRAGSVDLPSELQRALSASTTAEGPQRQYLEDWRTIRDSRIWDFNALYWNALGLWERHTGREYEQALPGGESDARNTAMARELITQLFQVWDNLAARKALPEDLYVLELGVGNGAQAQVWLDEFRRMDQEHGGDYYRRLQYLMGDYSPHVLDRARANVHEHADHVSGLVLDARHPAKTLGFLKYKAFLIYISNVYDNLPTDEIVRVGGQLFQVEARAFLPGDTAERIAVNVNTTPEHLPPLVDRLLDLGPEVLARAEPARFEAGVQTAVQFWYDVWGALQLEERYVPIEGLDMYEIAPGVGGELLRPLVEANGDVRMHVSNGAAASFLESLSLLHPFGFLQAHDLFVTSIRQYQTGFRGPGKYDGSVVNWVNGSLLTAIGKRRGFEVDVQSFSFRQGSNVLTLTARVQE